MSSDSDPATELFTAAQLAQLLNISIASVRRLQQGRHIPFFKVGGSIRFAKDDVVSYLAKVLVEPVDP